MDDGVDLKSANRCPAVDAPRKGVTLKEWRKSVLVPSRRLVEGRGCPRAAGQVPVEVWVLAVAVPAAYGGEGGVAAGDFALVQQPQMDRLVMGPECALVAVDLLA